MTAAFLAGVVAGYGVAVPVGAIGVLIIGLAARTRPSVGAAAALGVATADALYALVAVLGGAALAGAVAPVAEPLRWLAALVLLALAAWTATGAVRRHRDPRPADRDPGGLTTVPRAYLALVALTALNPATVVYFAALVLGRRADGGWGAGAAFVAGAFLASASWQLLLAAGGSLVGRVLAGPQARLATALVSSAIIAGLAGWVLLS
jgi:arginine exporter protein ArgO